MSHMLSIGYGTLPPTTNTDTWMVIISMMLGASFYALFIASMSGLIMSMDLSGKKYDEMVCILVPQLVLYIFLFHGQLINFSGVYGFTQGPHCIWKTGKT